ncbi:CHASE domain-containing protein [Actinoplanes sp. M2I2]|uniref:CHASE domain-containing protein n=1 Tax=Actinoplanes sp. M2I2 TaxID=1734444 RepID=UPI0020201089|nr:CHASE domain-containing protein [Actinoplanes sp. M2I2]
MRYHHEKHRLEPVAQSSAPLQALAEARRSGRVTVSGAYHLIRDQHLPVAQRQLSFVLTTAVYGPADAAGTRAFRGWLLSVCAGAPSSPRP